MFFKDNSKYCYNINKEIRNVENIGWLSKESTFNIGYTTSIFKKKLLDIIIHKHCNKMRGTHYCDICDSSCRLYVNKYGLINELVELSDFNENNISLGCSEIWIPSSMHTNIIYAAPTLIYHYIIEHDYLPPSDYIESILNFDIDSEWNGDNIISALLNS